MRAAHSRLWIQFGLAVTAVGMLSAVVLSGVTRIQDASDRAH